MRNGPDYAPHRPGRRAAHPNGAFLSLRPKPSSHTSCIVLPLVRSFRLSSRKLSYDSIQFYIVRLYCVWGCLGLEATIKILYQFVTSLIT